MRAFPVHRSLTLPGNYLTGTLPSSLGLLTKLASLQLDGNYLYGTFPSTMSALTALTSLSIPKCQFPATVDSFFVFPSLRSGSDSPSAFPLA